MNRELTRTRFGASVAAAALLLLTPALATPLGAQEGEEKEERKIVKKVRIECEGSECEDGEKHVEIIKLGHGENHAFAWSTGDHPRRFMFRTHAGGGFLGVLLAELTPELRIHFGVPEDAGVMISKVVDDSPAAKAGLRVGDIVTAVDGERVASGSELGRAIRGKKEGAAAPLEIWRDGSVHKLTATVEERQAEAHGMDWAFVVKCDEGEEDCSFDRQRLHADSEWDLKLDCEGDDPCNVEVKCDDAGACECTVNGEAADCEDLPGFDD